MATHGFPTISARVTEKMLILCCEILVVYKTEGNHETKQTNKTKRTKRIKLTLICFYVGENGVRSKDTMAYLRATLRKSVPYYRMKLMVVGLQVS